MDKLHERLLSWFWYPLRRWIRNINRIIDYLPIIWNDVDFDAESIFPYLEKKFERLEPTIRNGFAVDAQKTADQVKTALELCKRINRDSYINNAWKAHERAWGKSELNWDDCRLTRKYEKTLSEKELKLAKAHETRCYKHAKYLEDQDIDYFFTFVRKHYRSWWD